MSLAASTGNSLADVGVCKVTTRRAQKWTVLLLCVTESLLAWPRLFSLIHTQASLCAFSLSFHNIKVNFFFEEKKKGRKASLLFAQLG